MRTLELGTAGLLACLASIGAARTIESSRSAGTAPGAAHVPVLAGVVFVDSQPTGSNDGTSWAKAHVDLCAEGPLQAEPGEDPPDPANFPGCIDTPPLLVDLAAGEYELHAGSPCIDAGNNPAALPLPGLDLAGAPRFFDDPATADTGVGSAPLVDMGAYELGSVPR